LARLRNWASGIALTDWKKWNLEEVMDRDKRIRDRAYQIWQEEGRPDGKSAEHWEQARRMIEQEEASPGKRAKAAKPPVKRARGRSGTSSIAEPMSPGPNGENPAGSGSPPTKPSSSTP
jgi:hypothetical protein